MRFPFVISATAEASDFKFGVQLAFDKAHHKSTPKGKVDVALIKLGRSRKFGVPFLLFMQHLKRDFKFGVELVFVKAHHKNTLEGKMGVDQELSKLLAFDLYYFCNEQS